MRDLVRFVRCSTCNQENVPNFNFCFHCGEPAAAGATVPACFSPGRLIAIDHIKLQARRKQADTAMKGRAGQIRKDVVATQFDLFLRSYSAGARGWLQGQPDDVVNWFCYLDSQGRGTKLVHEIECPGVGLRGRDRCLPGAACAKRYASDSLRKGNFSKLKMAYKEQVGRGEQGTPFCVRVTPAHIRW